MMDSWLDTSGVERETGTGLSMELATRYSLTGHKEDRRNMSWYEKEEVETGTWLPRKLTTRHRN